MAYPVINKSYAQTKYNLTKCVNRKTSKTVKYIVNHYTSTMGSAKNNCIYFGKANRNASADFFIDLDGSIYQFNGDIYTYFSWQCGDGKGKYGITNKNSIGIEYVSDGCDFTQKQMDAGKALIQALQEDFGVPDSGVVRHYDASRKICPKPYCGNTTNNLKWAKLHSYFVSGTLPAPEPAPDNHKEPDKKDSGLIDTDGIWGEKTTLKLQYVLNAPYKDGKISRQNKKYKSANPGLTSGWEWKTPPVKGSQTIALMQTKLGVKADGVIGPNTIKALQKRMGTVVDGELWKNSKCIKEMQRRLNAGTF